MQQKILIQEKQLSNIETLPIEMQDRVIAELVRISLGLKGCYSNDPVITSFVNMLLQASFEPVKTPNRALRDFQVYEYARQGLKASEIAEKMNCGVSTIQHNSGWRNRKVNNWIAE